MAGDDKGAIAVIALLLAWVGYRAGTRTQKVSTTWSDHRDLRTKTGVVGRLRWTHLVGAAVAWGFLVLAAIIVFTL